MYLPNCRICALLSGSEVDSLMKPLQVISHVHHFKRYVILCWFAGLLAGIRLAVIFPVNLRSLMCGVVFEPVSIVGAMVCLFLPLFLTVISVRFQKPWFTLVVCFYKSLSHYFCAWILLLHFQSAGWLVSFLLLFADRLVLLCVFAVALGYREGRKISVGYIWFLFSFLFAAEYSWISAVVKRAFC